MILNMWQWLERRKTSWNRQPNPGRTIYQAGRRFPFLYADKVQHLTFQMKS